MIRGARSEQESMLCQSQPPPRRRRGATLGVALAPQELFRERSESFSRAGSESVRQRGARRLTESRTQTQRKWVICVRFVRLSSCLPHGRRATAVTSLT